MLRFISFGSGSSGNCYYLYTETDSLIIDAGVGIRSLKKDIYKVHRILITHDHADHIKCVGSMSHDFQLPVFATRTVHEGIDRNFCVVRKVSGELRQYLEPGVTVQLGEFSVTPFTVPHDSSDNVGYMIEVQDTTFCVITDAGRVTDEMAQYIRRAEHLVIEANHDREMLKQGPYPEYLKERITNGSGHLNNEACAQAIATNMCEHLRHVWNNHPELARKTVESILRSYGIVVGKDIELEVLKRTKPTGIFDCV